jgi:uncharacterized repeat protein (TIGR04076 family)
LYKVILQVIECKGECPIGYKIGDKIVIEDEQLNLKETDKVCLYALGGFLPYITALYRDTPVEDWINRKEELQCPDNKNAVIFRVVRVRST